jgi:hypothetical protein
MQFCTHKDVRFPEGWDIRIGNDAFGNAHCDPHKREIVIRPEYANTQHTIAHESYHARIHSKKNLFPVEEFEHQDSGWKKNYHFYHEVRAYLYQIHWCLKHNDREGLEWAFDSIIGGAYLSETPRQRALAKIRESHVWARLCSYLGKGV